MLSTIIRSHSQKYSNFKSDFTIKEKRGGEDKAILMVGSLVFDNVGNKTTYNIKFPKKETWILQDSFLTIIRNDSTLHKKTKGNLNEYLMFKNILEYKDNDFGLTSMGFKIQNVDDSNDNLLMTWSPPQGYDKFIKKVETTLKDNLLTSVIVTDVDNFEISKIFYDDYKMIQDLPVPYKITSQVSSKKEDVFKSISFKNVEIQ